MWVSRPGKAAILIPLPRFSFSRVVVVEGVYNAIRHGKDGMSVRIRGIGRRSRAHGSDFETVKFLPQEHGVPLRFDDDPYFPVGKSPDAVAGFSAVQRAIAALCLVDLIRVRAAYLDALQDTLPLFIALIARDDEPFRGIDMFFPAILVFRIGKPPCGIREEPPFDIPTEADLGRRI